MSVRHIHQDTICFVKWRIVQLCITNFLICCPWRNNCISGITSLKALREESLVCHGLIMAFGLHLESLTITEENLFDLLHK